MENETVPVNNSVSMPEASPATSPSVVPPVREPNTNESGTLKGVLAGAVILIIVLVAAAAYLFIQNQRLTATQSVQPSPSTSAIVAASMEEVSDWQTYSDTINGFSFKYPSTYQITKDVSQSSENSILVEVKNVDLRTAYKESEIDSSLISDVAITGRSETFKKAVIEKSYNGFIAFFPLNRSLTLVVSHAINGSVTDTNANNLFNQILSTFQFTNSTLTSDPISILKEITKPMVWSTPKQGTMTDLADKEVSGMLMTSPTLPKGQDKIYPLLATESALTTVYGWKNEGGADGVGENITVFSFGGKTIIIRTGQGLHTILVED